MWQARVILNYWLVTEYDLVLYLIDLFYALCTMHYVYLPSFSSFDTQDNATIFSCRLYYLGQPQTPLGYDIHSGSSIMSGCSIS